VLEHVQAFRREWVSVVEVWEGGLTLYGGVVAGTLGGLLMARHLGLPMWRVADAVTPSFAIGTMFGRVGCLLNGCCYGVPTTMPWGVHFPPDSFAGLEFGNAAVHPSQLYFALAGLVLFGVTWRLRKRFETPGTLFWLFMLLFALVRVLLDMTRAYEPESTVATWGMVTIHESQVVSLALALFSMLMILRLRRLASGARVSARAAPRGSRRPPEVHAVPVLHRAGPAASGCRAIPKRSARRPKRWASGWPRSPRAASVASTSRRRSRKPRSRMCGGCRRRRAAPTR
jgi:phosphatidylglycerol:prolipoprotein diacylglycerol transferase